MKSELIVKSKRENNGFYISLSSPFILCGVFTNHTEEELLAEKNNPKFFFDILFDSNLEMIPPDHLSTEKTNREVLLTANMEFVPVSKDNASSDLLVALHRSETTGNYVLIADFEDRKVQDCRRVVMSGRNIYDAKDTIVELDQSVFDFMTNSNSHQEAANRLAPLVKNDDLANKEDYFVVDYARYDLNYF